MMNALLFFIALVIDNFSTIAANKSVVLRSSCEQDTVTPWNHRNLRWNLEVWWNSLTSVFEESSSGPHLLFYKKRENSYKIGYTGAGKERIKTVTRALVDGLPRGLSWRMLDIEVQSGFLYGQPALNGSFTGDDLLFVYPDFQTGLHGRFVDGVLVAGKEVRITAERCNHGIKQLKYKHKNTTQVWTEDISTDKIIGRFPLIRDPFERKALFLRTSEQPGGGEGVFARRDFLPGDLVSYFNGMRTYTENFLFDNLTSAEYWTAHAYFLNFAGLAPDQWKIPRGMVIDIPMGLRKTEEYTTSLGHKINHRFLNNVDFEVVQHPVFGPIGCLIASKPVARGEELYAYYGYDLTEAPEWYTELYHQTKNTERKISKIPKP